MKSSYQVKWLSLIAVIVIVITHGLLYAAEFNIRPSIYGSAEYTDNAELKPDAEKQEDFITRVVPSIVANYNTPLMTSHLKYELEYLEYQNFNSEDELNHFFEAAALTKIVKDWFFLDLKDRYLRESLDITRDFTAESFFVNQSQKNEFTAEPYLYLRPTGRISLKTGYQYMNTWYRKDIGNDFNSHFAYGKGKYTVSPKLALTGSVDYKLTDSEFKYEVSRFLAGLNYKFAPYSTIMLSGGEVIIDINEGDSYSQVSWEASISHVQKMIKGVLGTVRWYSEVPTGNPERVDKYWISIMRLSDYPELESSQAGIRFQFDITVSYEEYTDLITRDLVDTKYGLFTRGSYDFTTRLIGSAHFSAEKIKREDVDTTTKRYIVGADFAYKLPNKITVILAYIYGKSKTPETYLNNYTANRYIISARKEF
jgi:hypothetical protein